jgi:hypothetical protein
MSDFSNMKLLIEGFAQRGHMGRILRLQQSDWDWIIKSSTPPRPRPAAGLCKASIGGFVAGGRLGSINSEPTY